MQRTSELSDQRHDTCTRHIEILSQRFLVEERHINYLKSNVTPQWKFTCLKSVK